MDLSLTFKKYLVVLRKFFFKTVHFRQLIVENRMAQRVAQFGAPMLKIYSR